MNKTIPVFSQHLAGYLMQCGFVLISMQPNNNGSNKNVFYFMQSDEIQKAINKWLVKRK
jgi:hypothetical protein